MDKNTVTELFLIFLFLFLFLFHFLANEFLYPLVFITTSLMIIFQMQGGPVLIPKKFFLLLGGFFLINLFSALKSPLLFTTILAIIKLASLGQIVILGFNLFKNRKNYRRLFLGLILIGAFLAFIGICEYTSRHQEEKYLSLLLPFYWPSLAATFFLLIFPLTLIIFLKEKGKNLRKIFLFLSLFLITSAWILSKAFLEYLFLITLTLFIFFFKKADSINNKKRQAINLFLLILLSVVILPNFFPSFGFGRLPSSIISYQDKIFFMDRNDIWRFSKQIIRKNPWWGIGPGNFAAVYRQTLEIPWTWADFANNEILQASVETGLIGALVQFILFLYLGITCFNKIKRSFLINQPSLAAISISVFLFFLINFNHFSFQIFPLVSLAFLFLSIILVSEKAIMLKPKIFLIFTLPFFLASLLLFSDALLLKKGQFLFNQEDYQASERIFNFLLSRPKSLLNHQSLVWLSAIQIEKGEVDQALTYLEKFKILSPYNQEIDYQITQILYKQGDIKSARNYLEEKIETYSFLPPKYYFTVANLYLEENQILSAIEWLKKGIGIYPLLQEKSNPPVSLLLAKGHHLALWKIYLTLFELTRNPEYLPALAFLVY